MFCSGSAIMKDGCTVTSSHSAYPLDLDAITVGSRIGMMRGGDGTLHYFLNGEDQGVACTDIPTGGSVKVVFRLVFWN